MATVSCLGTSVRYKLIEKLRTEVSVKALINLRGVSKSSYYDWRNRQASERKILDDELKIKI